MKTLLLAATALVAISTSSTAKAESALDRYCRNSGVSGFIPCIKVAHDCGKPTEYAMVADRNCMAADIVTCWNRGLRPGVELDVCVAKQALKRNASSAHAADLPDAMMGSWGMDGKGGNGLVRYPEGADFYIDKDGYNGVDSECKILKVEKLVKNKYTVQARCTMEGDDEPPTTETNEFELKGDRLFITPVGS